MLNQNIKNTEVEFSQEKQILCVSEEDIRNGDCIGKHALAIIIRDGARSIPDYGLKDTKVDTVYIPSSVGRIGHGSFENSTVRKVLCRELKNGKMSGVHKPHKSKNVVIHKKAFKGCKNLQIFEANISEIDVLAFDDCSLQEKQLRESGKITDETIIHDYAFGLYS